MTRQLGQARDAISALQDFAAFWQTLAIVRPLATTPVFLPLFVLALSALLR